MVSSGPISKWIGHNRKEIGGGVDFRGSIDFWHIVVHFVHL